MIVSRGRMPGSSVKDGRDAERNGASHQATQHFHEPHVALPRHLRPEFEARRHAAAGFERRLLIVDPRRLNRECLAEALSARLPGFEVECVADWADADRAALDVAVVRLCERSDATNDVAAAVAALLVRAGDAPTLILCERADEATDAEALRAGAAGLFPLHCGSEMLAAAVQLVAAGGTFYAPQRRDNGVVHARR